MKRFLLFCGAKYYPGPGWADFAGSFDDVDAAYQAASAHRDRSGHAADWYHVVDSRSGLVVLWGGDAYGPEGGFNHYDPRFDELAPDQRELPTT